MLSLAGSIALSGNLLEETGVDSSFTGCLGNLALAADVGSLRKEPLGSCGPLSKVPEAGLALCSSKCSFQPPPPRYCPEDRHWWGSSHHLSLGDSDNGHHLSYSDCKVLLWFRSQLVLEQEHWSLLT